MIGWSVDQPLVSKFLHDTQTMTFVAKNNGGSEPLRSDYCIMRCELEKLPSLQ